MQYGLGMQGVENVTSLSGGMSANAGAPMQADKGETRDQSFDRLNGTVMDIPIYQITDKTKISADKDDDPYGIFGQKSESAKTIKDRKDRRNMMFYKPNYNIKKEDE